MLHWLNTHIGTDWATYQGWGISIIGLGFTVFAAPKIIKKYKLRQTNKNNNGNINQAGRDLNITTINHISHSNKESNIEEKKKSHDLKIIEEILTLLPYEATLNEAEQSYLVGMTYQFARNLDESRKYTDEKYRLYNSAVNEAKDNFIIAITAFYKSLTPFLAANNLYRKRLRLDLSYNGNNNQENEELYQKHQDNIFKTSAVMIENYQLFIKTIKENEFITDTI